jgi:hydrogenase maturation protease
MRENALMIIGIGNEYRSDDGAGLLVARRLREILSAPVKIIEQSGEGAALVEAWKDLQNVILIDAVHSGAEPGTIFRFEAHQQAIPAQFFHYSTHAFSVAEAIELARALNQLPASLIVYGIEGKNFTAGIGLSPEVEKVVSEVVARIVRDVELTG